MSLYLEQVAEEALAGEERRLGGVKAVALQDLGQGRLCQVSLRIDGARKLQTAASLQSFLRGCFRL